MAVQVETGSALSLGRLGLALGNGHAYAATGTLLGLSLAAVLVVAGGVLLIMGLTSVATPDRKKAKAERA